MGISSGATGTLTSPRRTVALPTLLSTYVPETMPATESLTCVFRKLILVAL